MSFQIEQRTYEGCIYECNYDVNFSCEKLHGFYDIFYESDTECV